MRFAVRWVMMFVLVSMAHAEESSLMGIPIPDQANPASIISQPLQSLAAQPAAAAAVSQPLQSLVAQTAAAAAAPVKAVNVPNTLPGTYSWFAARNICPTGWRLPTIEELSSRPISFAYAGRYWSASEYGIGIAWSYDAINKQASLNAVDSQLYVHCVP